ncbi:MAG: hypothetical protein J6Q25_06080, partial [Bacteroidales bacterium]|nr:hypothetical protein [Bacteroidales bacterium]
AKVSFVGSQSISLSNFNFARLSLLFSPLRSLTRPSSARKVGCGSEKKTSLGLFSFLYPSFSAALKASFQATFNSG